MLLKLRGMCAVLLAALAFAGCSDDDAASSLATNFDELEFSYEESDQQLLIRSTVPWTLDCTYLTGDGWLAFDKTSGPGDEGIVSQRVTIKALHNTGVERTAELHRKTARYASTAWSWKATWPKTNRSRRPTSP